MSEKKATTFRLGDSHLPADLLTPSLGSNYGLDGFPDMEYGMGVLDGVLDPEYMEGPALPQGLTRGAAEDMDLTAMLTENLADLDWLDPTQMQDPERLPENPVDLMIPELEEAWGVNRRTDGLNILAARDLNQARYESSLKATGTKKKATAKQMLSVVSHAMRRSAAGHDINVVIKEAMDSMGEEMGRIVPHLRAVQAEHGLAGNVYIQAAVYPSYSSGKWAKVLNKMGARYVVVTDRQMKQATWIQDGRCIYTGKIAVTEVPWQAAFNHYSPRFEFRVAAQIPTFSGTPKDRLRQAFLFVPEKKATDSHLPVQPRPRMASAAEVQAELSKKAERVSYDPQAKRVAQGVAKVAREIQGGLKGELLRSLILRTFMDSDIKAAAKALTPILKETGALTSSRRENQYEGTVYHQASAAPVASDSRIAGQVRGALNWIRRAMSEGFAGRDLDDLIQNRFSERVLEAAEEGLQGLREAHEGGSGFLYVDASAYASPTGAKGCEEGALKHRANQIPSVATMDRCASCTLARTLEDGTRKCGAYNKLLLENPTDPDFNQMKQANIRVANMDDHEQTTSLFEAPNGYNPLEYGLRNANLENIDLDFPEPEKVAKITFGGWDL